MQQHHEGPGKVPTFGAKISCIAPSGKYEKSVGISSSKTVRKIFLLANNVSNLSEVGILPWKLYISDSLV